MSSVVSASYSVKSGIVPAIKLDKDRLHLISQPDGIEGPIIDRVLPGRVSVSHINHAKVIRFDSCGEVSRVKGRREKQQVVRFSEFLGKQSSDHRPPIIRNLVLL